MFSDSVEHWDRWRLKAEHWGVGGGGCGCMWCGGSAGWLVAVAAATCKISLSPCPIDQPEILINGISGCLNPDSKISTVFLVKENGA